MLHSARFDAIIKRGVTFSSQSSNVEVLDLMFHVEAEFSQEPLGSMELAVAARNDDLTAIDNLLGREVNPDTVGFFDHSAFDEQRW